MCSKETRENQGENRMFRRSEIIGHGPEYKAKNAPKKDKALNKFRALSGQSQMNN